MGVKIGIVSPELRGDPDTHSLRSKAHPLARVVAYFRFGACPRVWSCPKAEAAKVRDCEAVGLIAPDKTPDARVETLGEVWRGGGDLAIEGSYF